MSSEATTFETLVEIDYFAKVDSVFRLQVPKGFAPDGYLTATGPLYHYMYLRSSLTENGRSLGQIQGLVAPVAREALQLGLGTLGIEQLKRSNNVVRILNEEVEKNEI